MQTFSKGIHVPDNKGISSGLPISEMPVSNTVYISLRQHIGAAAIPVVEIGDTVKTGQLIAKAASLVSANIFASISGTIIDIVDMDVLGGKAKHIVIEGNKSDEVFAYDKLDSPTKAQIIERIRDCGVVGMGGAGFPTDVKLSPSKPVDTLVINAAECEPYITCDHRIMLDYSEEFLSGVGLLAKALGIDKNIYIGIESNKQDAITKLETLCKAKFDNITIVPLQTKYPQGGEKQLVYAVTKRRVPIGELPFAVGVSVSNVSTALSVHFAVKDGQTLYKRVVTVSGRGVKSPANIWVRIGTKYQEVLEYAGMDASNTAKLISGGTMMGSAVANLNTTTSKTTSCLLALSKEECFLGEISPCINCAKCAKACPMKLMPMFIESSVMSGGYDSAVKYGAKNCIECGCCAYVCPAKRPLVQSIRQAKGKISELKL